ncbi:hypothetical protein EJB05_38740, partial [Eragrostis curvula]
MAFILIHELIHEAAAAPAAFSVALLFSLALLARLFVVGTSSTRTKARRDVVDDTLPSPPRRLPVVGHLHHLTGGTLPPHVSLAFLASRHGPDLMLLRLGAVPAVVASSPRAAEAVLRTHDHALASRPRTLAADVVMYGATDSCFAPYGDHFRKARKLVTAHLLSAGKVRSQRRAREEEVRLALGKVAAAAASGGAAVDMSELLHSFVNDLVCRFVSGKFSRGEGSSRNRLFRELTDINAALLGGFGVEYYFPRLARLQLFSKVACAKARSVRKRWDQLLDKLIDDHATRATSGAAAEQEDTDFIDVLLTRQEEYGLTRDHVKAILILVIWVENGYT